MTKKIPKIIGMHKRYLASEKYSWFSRTVRILGPDFMLVTLLNCISPTFKNVNKIV